MSNYEDRIQNKEILGKTCDGNPEEGCGGGCSGCGGKRERISTIWYVLMAAAIIGFAFLLRAIGLIG